MSNVYNVLFKPPALEKWQMPIQLERLAQQLVQSGRLRIDANEKVNFVRFSHPAENINIVFSYRELCDPELSKHTTQIIEYFLSFKYKGKTLHDNVQSELQRLRHDVTKIIGVDTKTEIRIARAIVQAIDPPIIMLLLAESAELFVSYSHIVGDMLDIQSWQTVGNSSGLQSTSHMENAVFVSCGGNPFLPEKKKQHSGDGYNALARMIIIGGQELGHFADIIRNKNGHKTSRYSANLNGTRAKAAIRKARHLDIAHASTIEQTLVSYNLLEISELERHIKFFKKHKRRGLITINTKRRANNKLRAFFHKCNQNNLNFITQITADSDKHKAIPIRDMLYDMLFNLAPKADAYKRDSPTAEEAIACIEALARVPQQVNKWGHLITKNMIPHLYDIYYNQVVPGCINALENITNTPYHWNPKELSLLQKFYYRFFSNEP